MQFALSLLRALRFTIAGVVALSLAGFALLISAEQSRPASPARAAASSGRPVKVLVVA
jgi:hypothetical protein